jgi:hypothetical protein
MKFISYTFIVSLTLVLNSVWADTNAINHYKTLTVLDGDWILSPANAQEGGATKKGPAAKLVDTDMTAMSFKVIGKGSAVQENLLPGTGKEMVSMYHCNDFKNCLQVEAKHYCAKQNKPELVLDAARSNDRVIVVACNMNTDTVLCNSGEGHVHMIKHELSQESNHLKTTYTIYSNCEYEKDSICHFDRKQ